MVNQANAIFLLVQLIGIKNMIVFVVNHILTIMNVYVKVNSIAWNADRRRIKLSNVSVEM